MSHLYKNSFTARDERSMFIIGLVNALIKDQSADWNKDNKWYFRVTKIEEVDEDLGKYGIHQTSKVVFETDEDYEVFYARLKKALRRSDAEHAYKTVATLKPTAEFDGEYSDLWNKGLVDLFGKG